MWPATPRWWLRYEHAIRHAAGMGKSATAPDPDSYEHQYAHCDVLVIGAGPAGLAAALSAARSGARVIVCDERPRFGGELVGDSATIDGAPAAAWLARVHGRARQPSRCHHADSHYGFRRLRRQSRRARRARHRARRDAAADSHRENGCGRCARRRS
jgi:glycine/D-amino acid oxidase-like deaminating enzyme